MNVHRGPNSQELTEDFLNAFVTITTIASQIVPKNALRSLVHGSNKKATSPVSFDCLHEPTLSIASVRCYPFEGRTFLSWSAQRYTHDCRAAAARATETLALAHRKNLGYQHIGGNHFDGSRPDLLLFHERCAPRPV